MRSVIMTLKAKKDEKVRNTITMQIKEEIIEKHQRRVKVDAMANEYGIPKSTVSTIMGLFVLHLFIIYPRLC
jgi:predicted transcriptional regulator